MSPPNSLGGTTEFTRLPDSKGEGLQTGTWVTLEQPPWKGEHTAVDNDFCPR